MFGWTHTWAALLVPTMHPPFADLRTVQGSIFSLYQGFDPQSINPGDPWNRGMNYPSIWISIANFFSLNKEPNYLIFVSTYVLIYLWSCFNILRKNPSLWMLIAIFSGSSLLAVERGNNDLMVFSLLYFSSLTPALLSGAIIIFASTLKIYPIFSVVSLYANKKTLLTIAALVGIYFLTQIPELHKIRNGTPISASLSYGAPSIAEAINSKLKISISPWTLSLCMVLFAITLGASNKVKAYINCENRFGGEFKLFMIGASIYLSTFIISSNWDYRLIFLIFCIPFIEKLVNRWIKIPLLIAIILGSNQIILTTLLGTIVGTFLCISAKCIIFLCLILLIQNNINKFIDLDLLRNRFKNKVD
jgi:hypothetical protein